MLLAVAMASSATHLSLNPWSGPSLATATGAAVKYRLRVAGTPNAAISLHADGVAKGWLAAFCTPKVCSPMRVDVTLPASGQAVYQFELIREETGAAAHSGARILSSDGASIIVK